MKRYTESEIQEAAAEYAERHGLDADDVDVCRQFYGDDESQVIGFRLSPGDGTTTGDDERFGMWGQSPDEDSQ